MDEAQLRAKLRKVEALFARAGTHGEKAAAGEAAARIRARLDAARKTETLIEMKFSLGDLWSRRLFVALCRRYGLTPYRYRRQRHTTVMLKVPESFVDQVLWPEFQDLNEVLVTYISDLTDRIIRDEIFKDAGEADEVDGQVQIGGVP